jgi:hypothetical protein
MIRLEVPYQERGSRDLVNLIKCKMELISFFTAHHISP